MATNWPIIFLLVIFKDVQVDGSNGSPNSFQFGGKLNGSTNLSARRKAAAASSKNERGAINLVTSDSQQPTRTDSLTMPYEGYGEGTLGSKIGRMAWQAAEHYARGCQLVLFSSDLHHSMASHVIRHSTVASQSLVVVDITNLQDKESKYLLTAIWGVAVTVCRAVVIDLTSDEDRVMFRFLETHQIWRWPEAWVVVIGDETKAQYRLHHNVFRNTLQPVYLGLTQSALQELAKQKLGKRTSFRQPHDGLSSSSERGNSDNLLVYCRCLYCNQGESAVRFLFLWPLGSDLQHFLNPFPNQHIDTQGHLFRVVTMPTFPYNAQRLDSAEVATTVTLLDSLDKRMLVTLAACMNFTYETRAPWDLKWGVPTESGNFSGLIGTIQYNKADFTTTVAPTPERNVVIDTTKAYTSDVLSVVALKPDLLPQYLIIIRPFSREVWLCFLFTIVIWAVFLWLLLRLRSSFTGERSISLSESLFFSWAVILDEPPPEPVSDASARILWGVWLIASLVSTTGFQAALVSHLGVQGKTKPLDSFRDLVERGGYQWGMEARYLTGVSLIYFMTTSDPVAKTIYKHIEYLDGHEIAFEKILQGKYAMITFEKLAYTLIDSYYTDNVGNTPFYVSKEGYRIVPYFGWGYGKGSPFRDRFNMIMNRLLESGITDYWTGDVMYWAVQENRKEVAKKKGANEGFQIKRQSSDGTLKLRVVHLIGIFLILFLGFGISFATLLVERIVHKDSKVSGH